MSRKITRLQCEYLGWPEGVCSLSFYDNSVFMRALYWLHMWEIPWEYLLKDEYSDKIVPNTVVIPDSVFEHFQNSNSKMVGKFEAEWLECGKFLHESELIMSKEKEEAGGSNIKKLTLMFNSRGDFISASILANNLGISVSYPNKKSKFTLSIPANTLGLFRSSGAINFGIKVASP